MPTLPRSGLPVRHAGTVVALREVPDEDLPALHAHQAEPVAGELVLR